MLNETHEPWGASFWLAGTLALNAVAVTLHHPAPVPAAAVALGVPLTAAFSGGKNSPDIDQIWADGPPRANYHWRYHRGITHRVWFLTVLTALTWAVTLAAGLLIHHQLPGLTVLPGYALIAGTLLPLAYAPVTGWWSHITGDMIYGRIKICGRRVGLGWETGGIAESGGRWLRDPAAKVFTLTAVALAAMHLANLTGVTPSAAVAWLASR